MKNLFLSLALVAVGQTALAENPPYVDDLNLIDLNVNAKTLDFTYSYPGLGGTDGNPSPDCLVLVTGSSRFDQPENGAERLKNAINVFDGDEILFPGSGMRQLNALDAKLDGGVPLFYSFKDLGKFLTGVRVESKDGKALKKTLKRIGFKGPVALQIVRGCRVLPTGL